MSVEAVGNRYIKAYYNWNVKIMCGKYRIIETDIHINMTIDVYQDGRVGKCIQVFEYEHIELPAKLLRYFLRSNKSNINQSHTHVLVKRTFRCKTKVGT